METNSTAAASSSTELIVPSAPTRLTKTSAYDVVIQSSDPEPSTPLATADSDGLSFTTGNPSVEIIKGTLRLYRDPKNAMVSEGEVGPSDLVCVLDVPGYLPTEDLVDQCAKTGAQVVSLRLLRDAFVSERRVVLVRLASKADARLFHNDMNGKPYTSLSAGQDDCCRTVFVKSVTQVNPEDSAPLPVEIQEMVELPTCIVCLERLDFSVSGRTELTTLCNHTFHRDCLQQSMSQGNRACPVCRYCTDGTIEGSACQECGSATSLWICLICGFMGCGRYDNAHARKHFERTKHAYALDPDTQRVWDYAGDGYVHRLIQNLVDGKLVELPDVHQDTETRVDGESESINKSQLEDVMCHYEQELVRHLETQRRYFDQELRKAAATSVEAEQLTRSVQKKYTQLQTKHTAIEGEVEFLKQVNESLTENQSRWEQQLFKHVADTKIKLADRDERIADLEALNHDLMTSMETQSRIQAAGGAGGLMVLTDEPEMSPAERRRHKKLNASKSAR